MANMPVTKDAERASSCNLLPNFDSLGRDILELQTFGSNMLRMMYKSHKRIIG
jgi:hypothetical protein